MLQSRYSNSIIQGTHIEVDICTGLPCAQIPIQALKRRDCERYLTQSPNEDSKLFAHYDCTTYIYKAYSALKCKTFGIVQVCKNSLCHVLCFLLSNSHNISCAHSTLFSTSTYPLIIKVMYNNYFNLQREDNLSIKEKSAGPNMYTIRRFHCTQSPTGLCNRGE